MWFLKRVLSRGERGRHSKIKKGREGWSGQWLCWLHVRAFSPAGKSISFPMAKKYKFQEHSLTATPSLPVFKSLKLKSHSSVFSTQPGLPGPLQQCCNGCFCSDTHFSLKLTNGHLMLPFLSFKYLCVPLFIKNKNFYQNPLSESSSRFKVKAGGYEGMLTWWLHLVLFYRFVLFVNISLGKSGYINRRQGP